MELDVSTVKDRLKALGCDVSDTDFLQYLIDDVIEYVKNETNLSEVPEGLKNTAVNIVCGRYLEIKYKSGALTLDNLDLNGVESIEMGDTKVSFGSDTSDSAKLSALIDTLKNSGGGQFSCYRKVHW